jgi:hypothetical protein
MMKRKGMSCHTLPTSMISGVIRYWSPPGLFYLLSKVNLVFLVDLPFPCIYLQLLLSIWRRSHTCRSGVQLLLSVQCTQSEDLKPAGLEYDFSHLCNAHWLDPQNGLTITVCIQSLTALTNGSYTKKLVYQISQLQKRETWLCSYLEDEPVVSISCVHYHCSSLFGISGFFVAVLLHSFFMFYSCRIWWFAYIKFFVWLRI